MAYEIKEIYDIDTGKLISRTIKEVDALVNDRPLVELLYKKLMEEKVMNNLALVNKNGVFYVDI